MRELESGVYDNLVSGKIDPSKWTILSFPMGDGQTWTWAEPNAKTGPMNGGLGITVDPFTRKHDKIHMFDDPKQLYGSTRTFPVSRDRPTVFEVEMGARRLTEATLMIFRTHLRASY